MADPVTMSDMALLTKELSDSRRESATETSASISATKDARHDILDSTGANTDRLEASIVTVSRDTIDLRAQVTAVGYQVRDGFYAASKDAEINALKTQIEMAKQTTYLSDKIGDDGEKTRALIAGLNNTDLNRELIERNALLSEARFDGRHWRDRADMGQYAALNTQLQAFASQLQDVKQGTVNFGTMSGNAGRNQATNNVA